MAGLLTIFKKEAYTFDRFSIPKQPNFVTFSIVIFREKEVVTFCAKSFLHFALLYLIATFSPKSC